MRLFVTSIFISGIKSVSFEEYQQIDLEEMFRGKDRKKPREKITDSQEMLNIAFRTNKET